MKKKMLMILLFIMALTSIFAIDVEVGNGTGTASAVPIWGLYGYSWSNFIVPATFIGIDMEITELKVNVSNSPVNYQTNNQKVYVKHTTESLVPIGYPNPEQNGYTLIFEGDLVWDGSGWHGFVLDTPFEYDGTSNLQIVWENRHGTWAPDFPHFFVTEAGNNNVVVGASDASFPTHLPGLTESYFPNLLLTYEVDDEPAQATLVAPVDFATDTATTLSLEWALGANTTDVDVYFSNILPEVSGLNANAKVVDGQNITSYEVTDLDLLTTYYWRVVARNSAINLTTNSPMWRFTTGDDGLFTPITVGDGEVLSYQLPLNYFYYYSLTETIYLADELNIGGELQGITYYSNFGFNVLDSFVNVWVGETTQTDLSSYIPPSQLTHVFSGNLNMPSGENEVNIMFDSPITYSGGNLVLLVGKPLASVYYLNTEEFYCTETQMANRSIYWQNDGLNLDPENMPAGTTTNLMPNTTFQFVTTGMGSVVGTVTDGTTPLAGANITIEGTSNQTLSSANGTFTFPYVPAGDNYTLRAALHGYHDTTVSIDVVADEETIVNITMNSLPTVAVSGQIKAVDTGLGIQSNFRLTGYEAYEVSSDANGNFTVAAVYANQTYTGYATANGYQVTPVEVVVGSTDLNLGIILINETLFPVSNVVATLTGNDAFISWHTPLEIDGLLSFSDDFEGDMSNWDEVVNGPGTPGEGGIPYWHIGAPDDQYDGNCLRVDWGYNIDTWAITPFIAITGNTSINFEFCTSYQWFVSPYGNGDLSIKVSSDGTNWTELWTEEDYGPFADFDWINVNIPLSDYAGQSLQIAFNVTGSDTANLHIDNVFIGESRVNSNFVVATPNTTVNASAKSMSATNHGYTFTNNRRVSVAQNANNTSRAFESYNLYRFLIVDEENISNWTLVGEALTDTTYTDTSWNELTSGAYKFAVKTIYTGDNASPAAFSNILHKDMYGTVDGTVTNESNAPISGAVVHLDGGTATTDGSGYFIFTDILAGNYEITATATGYSSVTETITVVGTQLTSVDFTLAISDVVISDSFELYPDFALEAGRWVMVDGDMSGTYGVAGYEFPNAYQPMAYIIFNHSMTVPPMDVNFAARTGAKFAGSFAATTPPNNDWMMTEPFNLADSGTFSFWGRSVMDTYGLESFKVLVSTGSTNPSDFVSISGPTPIQAPVAWTNFTYDLSAYANQTIRVAIQCVSNDVFLFMVDDVEINAPGATDNQSNDAILVSTLIGNYPNPFNPETTIAFSTKESGQVSLDIYNIRGQKVRNLINDHRDAGNHKVVWNGKDDNGKSVASGVFFYRMKSGKFSSTKKMILMK